MNDWLSMLRAFYNFCLRDRIEAFESTKSPTLGEFCRIDNQGICCPLTCSVSKSATIGYPWTKAGKRRSAGMMQDAYLPEMKADRPWYKRINADVLQLNVKRLDEAYQKFWREKKGYPKFKTKSSFKSFSYKPGQVKINQNKIYLPSIGWCRFFKSRQLPDGFSIRTVTVRKKIDGWYVSVRLEDKSVPVPTQMNKTEVKSAIAVDMGIRKLCAISNKKFIANPRFGETVDRRRKIRSRSASRKKIGSKNRAKAYSKLGKLEQKVADRRGDYHWKIANLLVKSADVIIFEDLKIKNMMARCKPNPDTLTGKYLKNGQARKRGLNRVIADAAWGELKQKTRVVAEKWNTIVCDIPPMFSSQECHKCGYISPKNREGEKFLCERCQHMEDADSQASQVLLLRGLKFLGIDPLQLCGVPAKVTSTESKMETSSALVDEPRNPQPIEYVQLNLFDCNEWRVDQATG